MHRSISALPHVELEKSGALPDTSSPMISPNNPSTELKISITSTLTNLQFTPYQHMHVSHPNRTHLHSQARIRSIRQRSTTPIDPHANPTDQITHPDRDARPEECVASILIRARQHGRFIHGFQLGGEDDGHDDAVDGDDFAEDDGDKVLGSDPRRFDSAAQDRCAGYEDAPSFIQYVFGRYLVGLCVYADHAAPTTERPIQRPMPASAHA